MLILPEFLISGFRLFQSRVVEGHYLARIYLISFRPMFEYACELWDGCSQQDSDNLEKLQIEAGRIETGLLICLGMLFLHR
jgi:hypothetical protein